jgi:hypothetical protein
MANRITLPGTLNTDAAYIVREANGYRSREEITMAADAGQLYGGTVVGQRTATKEYVGWRPAATDGSQVAAGVLYEGTIGVPPATKVKRTITARDTEVNRQKLFFVAPPTPTAGEMNTAYASLATLGIVMR